MSIGSQFQEWHKRQPPGASERHLACHAASGNAFGFSREDYNTLAESMKSINSRLGVHPDFNIPAYKPRPQP